MATRDQAFFILSELERRRTGKEQDEKDRLFAG